MSQTFLFVCVFGKTFHSSPSLARGRSLMRFIYLVVSPAVLAAHFDTIAGWIRIVRISLTRYLHINASIYNNKYPHIHLYLPVTTCLFHVALRTLRPSRHEPVVSTGHIIYLADRVSTSAPCLLLSNKQGQLLFVLLAYSRFQRWKSDPEKKKQTQQDPPTFSPP